MATCIDTLIPIITKFINLSLSQGIVPDSIKLAIVSPLLKKSNLNSEILSNYRPVSNLTFVSKILEKVVNKQLSSYFSEHRSLDPFQSAYRKQYSTETALVRVTNDILRALDHGDDAVLVLLDLSAAFDTIDHNILLDRLYTRFGIADTTLSWIKSYLNHRKQSVIIGNARSKPTPLTHGVPQGSVLGPLLFSLYVGPLGDIMKIHGIHYMCYADDTQLYLTFGSGSAVDNIMRLQCCIRDIQSWMCKNMLKLNEGKTEVVYLKSQFRVHEDISPITVGSSVIDPSLSARNLGVIIDSVLSMSPHLKNLCRTATNSLRYISRLRKYLDTDATKKLVNAFVISKLDYCNALFYGLPDTSIQCLQRLQNTAARIVTRTKKYEHISPVLRELHWLPIKFRLQFKMLLLTYKCIHNMAPQYMCELLTIHCASRTLRSSNDVRLLPPKIQNVKTQFYGRRAFSVAEPELWNALPSNIKSSQSCDSFKANLKTCLFKCAFS